MTQAVQPVKKFQVGLVSAAIWKNGGYFNVEVTKSFKKDGDEKWQHGYSFGHMDLLAAIAVMQRAETWIAEQQ